MWKINLKFNRGRHGRMPAMEKEIGKSQGPMTYDEMVDHVERFDFIPDRRTADAACKAVWGIIASNVDEPTAEEITSELPGDLTMAKLRGHQVRRQSISTANFIQEIGTQFHLQSDQARRVVETVIHDGEQSLRQDSLTRLKQSVSQDLATLL